MYKYLKNKNLFLLNLQQFADPGEGGSEPDPEPTISKKEYDKLASELARMKKENKAKMSLDEQKEQELKDKDARILELEKTVKLSNVKAGLSVAGLDDKQIDDISQAYIKSDDDAFIKALNTTLKTITTSHEKEMEDIKLQLTPRPGEGSNGGTDNSEITKEEFDKMSYQEMYDLKSKNPELFNKLIK